MRVYLVGVISRVASVANDAVVLGITLRKTFYIFWVDAEARASSKITTALAYYGKHIDYKPTQKLQQ